MKQNIGISQVLNNEMNLCVPFNFLLFFDFYIRHTKDKKTCNIRIEKYFYKVSTGLVFIIFQKNKKKTLLIL